MATKTKPAPEANGQPVPPKHEPDLARIGEARRRFREAQAQHLTAAARAKDAKKEWEGSAENLARVLDEEFDPQPSLFHQRPQGSGPLEGDETWRDVPLSALSLATSVVNKLADAGIETVGELSDHGEPTAGGWVKRLADIKGLGPAAVEKIEAALDQFWAERAKQPAASEAKDSEAGTE